MRLTTLVCTLALLTGCATLDSALSDMGQIEEQTSKFDDVRRVVMSPAITDHGMDAHASFGLKWNTTLRDMAFLELELPAAVLIDRKKPLELIVDGERIALPSARAYDFGKLRTKYDAVVLWQNVTLKDYIITKDQIQKIYSCNECFYRVNLQGNEVFEGEINTSYKGYQSYVVGAFEHFYNYIWKG